MKAPRDDSANLSIVTILLSTHVFQRRYSLPSSDSPEKVRIGPVSVVELVLGVAICDVPGPPRGSFEERLFLEGKPSAGARRTGLRYQLRRNDPSPEGANGLFLARVA